MCCESIALCIVNRFASDLQCQYQRRNNKHNFLWNYFVSIIKKILTICKRNLIQELMNNCDLELKKTK